MDILLRQTKHNPALVGAAGVGKTAIVEGLAQRIVAGDVPAALRGARLIALDHVALLAGTIYRGQFEARVRRLMQALEDDPDVILFVDEMHNLIGQGSAVGVAMDAANMLKPALVRPDIRVIGATTQVEYDRWVKGDPALERRFQPVVVRELTAAETLEILAGAPRPARAPPRRRHRRRGDRGRAGPHRPLRDRPRPARQGDRRPRRGVRPRPGHGAACRRSWSTSCASGGGWTRRSGGRAGERAQRARAARSDEPDAFEAFAREFVPALERIGAEIERLFGGPRTGARRHGRTAAQADERTADRRTGGRPPPRPAESLAERRDRLDRELRRGLEQLGIVVRGADIARAVGVAVGKRIEWVS